MTYQTSAPIDKLSLEVSARCWSELVNSVRGGYLDLNPPYQRGDVWTTEQRMLLIYSILSGTPIPALIVNQRPHPYQGGERVMADEAVVDGRQRITSILMFMDDELPVPASWWPAEDVLVTEDTPDGPYVRWSGLSEPQHRHFRFMYPTPLATGKLATIQQEAELYLRVNGAGTPQADEDMARAARVAADRADLDALIRKENDR